MTKISASRWQNIKNDDCAHDKIGKIWQKGINRDFTESEWDLVFIESN